MPQPLGFTKQNEISSTRRLVDKKQATAMENRRVSLDAYALSRLTFRTLEQGSIRNIPLKVAHSAPFLMMNSGVPQARCFALRSPS